MEDVIKLARKLYVCEDIEIDVSPKTSVTDEGVWVQAWVWVPGEVD
jgi:hypothetical protein|tara:strand:+ start:423 stop:560 length:138 start_codon:yes stop_codon:yes gene_type:complete